MPKLFEGRGADDTVRVWVPGCATGEEVYSIAILLREHMDTLAPCRACRSSPPTSTSGRSRSPAPRAIPEALLDSVSPERRTRFFIPDGGSYVVAKEVRDLCIFSPHSVIRDPPFSRIDLVSCRNLLIYFGIDMQNQVIPIFHYALRPDGLSVPRHVGEHQPVQRPVRAGREEAPHFPPRADSGAASSRCRSRSMRLQTGHAGDSAHAPTRARAARVAPGGRRQVLERSRRPMSWSIAMATSSITPLAPANTWRRRRARRPVRS